MRSNRPYRPALCIDRIIEEIRRVSGTQLDPAIVRIAVEILGASRQRQEEEKATLETRLFDRLRPELEPREVELTAS